MILSEQTSNTTSNTLHEVRHSLLSSSSPIGSWVAPLASSHCPSGLMQFSLLAPPCCGWVGPFLPRWGPTVNLGPSLSGKSLTCFDHLGSSFPLAYLSIDVTGALVPYTPNVWCSGLVFSVLACLSVDVTGALVLLQLISLLLSFLLCACPFSMFSLRFASCFTLVKRTMLCTNIVCAALCLFGGLVVPCMSCPPGLVGLCCFCAPVSAPRCLPGFVALLAVLV